METTLPDQLSVLVEDTIHVVLSIGLQYLWIDGFCISSVDKDAQYDQILHMDEIYSNAVVTIVPLGDSPSSGLPGVRQTPRTAPVTAKVGPFQLSTVFGRPEKLIADSIWSSRAWTFQEGILSKRILVFTEHQMYFECQNTSQCEMLRRGEEDDYRLKSQAIQNNELLWYGYFPVVLGTEKLSTSVALLQSVCDYFEKDTTFQSDALNAFSGILHRYQKSQHKIRHYWGIPFYPSKKSERDENTGAKSVFIETLQWTHSGSLIRREGFPSWSWLGWRKGSQQSRIEFEEYLIGSSLRSFDIPLQVQSLDGTWSSMEDFIAFGGLERPPNQISQLLRLQALVASRTIGLLRKKRPRNRKSADQEEYRLDLETRDRQKLRSETFNLPQNCEAEGSDREWSAVLLHSSHTQRVVTESFLNLKTLLISQVLPDESSTDDGSPQGRTSNNSREYSYQDSLRLFGSTWERGAAVPARKEKWSKSTGPDIDTLPPGYGRLYAENITEVAWER